MGVNSEIVEFDSEGVKVRGWLYRREDTDSPSPAIVMIHGFTATSTGMVADQYAEAFAKEGIAALLIDPRGFGLSDGEPRHAVNEWKQARDVQAGIGHLTSKTHCVDPDRIAVWGDSIGGGIALVVASVDDRVAAVIAQVPAFGPEILPTDDHGAWFATIRDILLHGDLDSFDRDVIGPLPVVSVDQDASPSHLPTLSSFHWFINYGARYGTRWDNKATYELLQTPRPFESQPCVAHIASPVLMIVAEDDEMPGANSDVARHCYQLVPEPKELIEVSGGHFGLLYHDSPEFDLSARAQTNFLRKQLKPLADNQVSRRTHSA